MPTKMIVTDLDGSLLRTDRTISRYTASVFHNCSENGIIVVFATARPIRAVKMLNLDIGNDAAIFHNGAVIAIADNAHHHIGVEPEATKALLLQTAKCFSDMGLSVEIDDVLYANFDVSTIWSNTTAIMSDFTDLPDIPADKIIFGTAESDEVCEIASMLPDDLYSEIAENQILMVMNKNARKRNAVKKVAEYYGIPLSDIVAFGDDFNDIEMLHDCGIGIAVANAIDEVKAVADYICETNDNDGVAKWLEENVL